MCGIVGYIGHRKAFPILIKGLHRLEYRGYDSAGVALINDNGNLTIYKEKGKVAELENVAQGKDTTGTIGIAHTRWATHGEPNTINAHPHYSESHNLALVHNGIIENYAQLKATLTDKGFHFQSATDTEVLVQMIEFTQQTYHLDLTSAVRQTLSHVSGAYAIAVLDKTHPDCLVVARKGSPLVIGVGVNEFFIASDATPIVEYTNRVIYIGEEEIATLHRGENPHITDLKGTTLSHETKNLTLSIDQLEKGGFAHYMLKEIFEQPTTLRSCMSGRVNAHDGRIILAGFEENKERFVHAKRIIITACGTSWHAGLIAKYAIEEMARIPVEVEYSSEFRYRHPVIDAQDIVIAISQSGETADTLAAIQLAKEAGALVFAICNVVGASIPRVSDAGCYTNVGPEIGVASTKAFTAQVTALMMLTLSVAREKHTLSDTDYRNIITELDNIPTKVAAILEQDTHIADIASCLACANNCIYLGRGYNFPVALEGALKLKEISYIHAEGYPAAEMKHGPIALICEEMPVVVIAPQGNTYEKAVSNIQEIKARHGQIISVVTDGDALVSPMSDYTITIPPTIECLTPLLTVVPLQLLSYHIAVAKGCDVDQPRNLAKSVTVE